MSHDHRPCLRPHLGAQPADSAGQHVILFDQLRLSAGYLRLNLLQMEWVKLFDGNRTLRDIQADAMRMVGGQMIPLEVFEQLASVLDEALFLDSPRYREAIGGPVRAPRCIGVYEGDPQRLREQLHGLFHEPGASGLPQRLGEADRLRAVLAPHIDYLRGGVSYTHAFKELVENTTASLFVIIGTAHYSPARYTLTRKHFQTPLGVVPSDGAFIDCLVEHYGDGLFDDEVRAHLPEHSIELEVVLLQYLFEGKRDIRIVPLVVGSFDDCVQGRISPSVMPDIRRMVEALRAAEAQTPDPVCYIISGDLAHIGPKFRDPRPVHAAQLEHCREQDEALLSRAAQVDYDGYFEVIAEERDARRICGLPPTWTTLAAARPARGKVLHYDRYVHPEGYESVSFASMAFYR
jgi:AmmeMemoRadiSam system protein B